MKNLSPTLEHMLAIRARLETVSIPTAQMRQIADAFNEANKQTIDLLTKPWSPLFEMLSATDAHLKRITESIRYDLDSFNRLNESIRQHTFVVPRLFDPLTVESLQNVVKGFALTTVRDYCTVQRAGSVYVAEPLADSQTTAIVGRETALAGALAVTATGNQIEEVERAVAPVVADIEVLFLSELPALHPSLVEKWKGALGALNGNNPDRMRHAASSLRELLRSVVMRMVDNAAFEVWAEQQHPPFNIRKRQIETRVRFILRGFPARCEFIASDAASVVEILDMLSETVHGDTAPYSESQLRFVTRRVQGLIAAFLELRNELY